MKYIIVAKHIVFLSCFMRFIIHHIDQVDSTNNYVFELCKKAKVEEGSVYIADEQYAGRGHNQNHWESEKGKNLTLSLVIHPNFIEPAQQFLITQFVSLAITDLLKILENKSDVKIKWPNDIYIGDSKVCGILIQNSIVGNKIDYSIVGIGLNVNQKEFHSDAPNPISILNCIIEESNLDKLLNSLLSFIENRYKQLNNKIDLTAIEDEYLLNLYRYKKVSEFIDNNGSFTGEIVGIGEYGRLIISTESGFLKQYNFKEIEFIL